MKNFFYLICLAVLAISCSQAKHTTAVQHPHGPSTSVEPVFLDNITIKPAGASDLSIQNTYLVKGSDDLSASALSTNIEACSSIQFKYAILMEDKVENVTNKKLIFFLEEWYGIPYKYGGGTKAGIDCSAFSSAMMDSVYNLNVPRTCREQYDAGKKIKRAQLLQGDLVFFNTSGGVSHVGVYLGNDKFVHASTSSGVMISDLTESYFKRRYVGSARFR